ncbi:hypothetical protein IWX47DRAFT_842290 [Phyllosticta citricarpa]
MGELRPGCDSLSLSLSLFLACPECSPPSRAVDACSSSRRPRRRRFSTARHARTRMTRPKETPQTTNAALPAASGADKPILSFRLPRLALTQGTTSTRLPPL